jgi:hypothetical protein
MAKSASHDAGADAHPEPSTTPSSKFHHRSTDENDAVGCSCPIHRGRNRDPFTAPLGKSFASEIGVETIDRDEAGELYEQHHGYMPSVPQANVAHHGITYQDNLVGAITYRYALMRHKKIHLCANGNPLPQPRTEQEIRDKLPERLHQTALDTLELDRIDEGDVAETRVVDGDHFMEAARICVGVDMANLASASLAHSQEKFVVADDCEGEEDIEYLLTFVRSDFDGAMIRALRDKGWTCVGWTRPSQASNREDKEIREHRKWTFVCPVENIHEQQSLREWIGT